MRGKKSRRRAWVAGLGVAIVLVFMVQSCVADRAATGWVETPAPVECPSPSSGDASPVMVETAPPVAFEVVPLPALSPEGGYLVAARGRVLELLSFPALSPVSAVYSRGECERFVDATGEAGPWSPAGDRFVFAVAGSPPEGPSSCRLFLGDLAGRVRAIAEAPGIGLVVWSPEGRRLFVAPPPAIIDVDTGEQKRLELPPDAEVRSPVFSPDGLSLAFTLFMEGEDLWLWDWTKGDLRRITEGGEGCYPKKWVDAYTVLVGLGAVSSGGGHEYGLGKVDIRGVGYTALDADPRSVFRYLLHLPQEGLAVGSRLDNIAGEGARVVLKDLSRGGERAILEGVWAVQARRRPDSGVAVVVVDGDLWRIAFCEGSGDTVRAMVTSDEPLRLLGAVPGTLYYLQRVRSGGVAPEGWELRRVSW